MEIINLKKKVPTEREIAELEAKLKTAKELRQQATLSVMGSIKANLDQLPDYLGVDEAMKLMKMLQNKLRRGHKKIRGSRVPMQLKSELVEALKQGEYSLSQLEKMFNLSVSYISRVKKELRQAGILGKPQNQQYTDHQLVHQS